MATDAGGRGVLHVRGAHLGPATEVGDSLTYAQYAPLVTPPPSRAYLHHRERAAEE